MHESLSVYTTPVFLFRAVPCRLSHSLHLSPLVCVCVMSLYKACEQGNLDKVKELIIKGGQDINKADEWGWRPLMLAASWGHAHVAKELINNSANVHLKGPFDRTALHWAAYRGRAELVQVLQINGAGLNDLDKGGRTPLMHAAEWGHDEVVLELIRAGADLMVVDEQQQNALHIACKAGHVGVVRLLIQAGIHINAFDKQKFTPLMLAAEGKHRSIVEALVKAGAFVNVKKPSGKTAILMTSSYDLMKLMAVDVPGLSIEDRTHILWYACNIGDSRMVESIVQAGCSLDKLNEGVSPLMEAVKHGYDEITKELILGGCKVDLPDRTGKDWTALHYAAEYNRVSSAALLVEAGASVAVLDKDSHTSSNMGSKEFQETLTATPSFTTKRSIAVLGDAGSGKSTLISALQAESKGHWKKFTDKFTKVQDVTRPTAGVAPVPFASRKYGDTLFYDFAGESKYRGPHQSLLEAMLYNPKTSMILLVVVKANEEEGNVMQQLLRWLQPIALATSVVTPQVIVIGSFLDMGKSKGDAAKKLQRCVQQVQKDINIQVVADFMMDCRYLRSEAIPQLRHCIQASPPPSPQPSDLSYSLSWVVSKIRSSIPAHALPLHKLVAWVDDMKADLPRNLPPLEEVCQDLSAAGYALFLPNERDPSHSWLILDLPAILHDVYGTLFSGSQGKVSEFGLLHCSQLAELFPKLDLEMIQDVLISLGVCIRIDPTLVQRELFELAVSAEGDKWLFFPALVTAQPPEVFSEVDDPQTFQWACWQLRTAEKHCISERLLHAIILHLAESHIFSSKESPSACQNSCRFSENGLSWRSTEDVDVAVTISGNNTIQVIGRGNTGSGKLYQYLSTVTREVVGTVTQLTPKLDAMAYLIHVQKDFIPLQKMQTFPAESTYPMSSIVSCVSSSSDQEQVVASLGDDGPAQQVNLVDLFDGWIPTLDVVDNMVYKRDVQIGEYIMGIVSTPVRLAHLFGRS